MPLSMASVGTQTYVKKINGKDETKRFLESLGFVAGECVTIISEMGGNIIIRVKDSRIALDKRMASRIIV